MQRAIQEHEENSHGEDEEEEVLPMDMLDDENLEFFSNNHFKKQKVKKLNEDDDCTIEDNYKPKVNLNKENGQMKQRKKLLPIKGETGLIEQYMDIEVKKSEEEVKVKEHVVKREEKKKVKHQNGDASDEKPKTMVEVLLQKKILFEKTKEKIGLLCRAIIENPQNEVIEYLSYFYTN